MSIDELIRIYNLSIKGAKEQIRNCKLSELNRETRFQIQIGEWEQFLSHLKKLAEFERAAFSAGREMVPTNQHGMAWDHHYPTFEDYMEQ
jgi:hypothetical protein